MNNLLSYFGLVDPIISASDKDLPVCTVQRTSFTVIVTYFFYNGKIHAILNKLQKLEEKDYDSKGTAAMLIKVLCDTLGVTESKLSRILKHLVYDGVYAGELRITIHALRTQS